MKILSILNIVLYISSLVISACNIDKVENGDKSHLQDNECMDDDGDGFYAGGCDDLVPDCDDNNPSIYPEADEIPYDGVDQNCDGSDLRDVDGDGFDAEAAGGDDCDDSDATIYPGAEETCGNSVDEDCDGSDIRCAPLGTISLSSPDATFTGEEIFDSAGTSLSSGDLDADGYSDIIIGAPSGDYEDIYEGGPGRVCLWYGPVSGDYYLSSADAIFEGENSGDHAGVSVSTADINGDGFNDIVIGADRNDENGDFSGKVYFIKRPGGAVFSGIYDLSSADATLTGENSWDYAGHTVATGDVNDDGNSDIIVGTLSNKVYLFYGPVRGTYGLSSADVTFTGENLYDYAGIAISTGDINGDSYGDVIIGASNNDDGGVNAGKVYLFYGPLSGTYDLSSADATFTGENPDDYAGISVFTGDLNSNGYSDLLIGAVGNDDGGVDAGKIYLFYGPLLGNYDLSSADASFTGENRWAGLRLCSGDVDNDGYSDIFIGSLYTEAYLIYGPAYGTNHLSSADATFIQDGAIDYFISSISTGDVNYDGYSDILWGAAYYNDVSYDEGRVYLFFGGHR